QGGAPPPPPPPSAYGARYPDIGLFHGTTVPTGSPAYRDHWKKRRQKARPSSIEPKRSGNAGRYLSVLKCASEYGLSLEQWGRDWLFVTPRSANSRATGLEAMDVPRSA